MTRPFEPAIWTEALAGTGGSIGPSPEDFVVDEVPLYAPSGAGDHWYVRVKKRARTTRDLIRAVGKASGIRESEIGSAGMKDKHAVTTQWLSLPVRAAKPTQEWNLGDDFQVVETTRHTNKLRTGHLSGNRFRIRLTGVVEHAEVLAKAVLDDVAHRGMPNYFGAQRFGLRGDNLAAAIEWARGSSERRSRTPPFERKLLASVLQAEVFNRYVAARVREPLDRPLAGEVVRLDGSRALFEVEDPAREEPRWRGRDIHPTGPIFGPKMRASGGLPRELEQQALEALDLGGEALTWVGRFADGTRRDVLVYPTDVALESNGPDSLVVSFFLPSGSYATLLVRELTRGPFFSSDPR